MPHCRILVLLLVYNLCSIGLPCQAQYATLEQSTTGGLDNIYSPRNCTRSSSGDLYSVGTFSETFVIEEDTLDTAFSYAVYVAKYNQDLDLIWFMKVAENDLAVQETWARLVLDNEDNMIIGLSYSGSLFVNNDTSGALGFTGVVLMKVDPNGNYLWNIEVQGDVLGNRGLEVDDDNNILVTGTLGNDMFTSKFNSNGIAQWNKVAGGPNNLDKGNSIVADNNGNVYVSGLVTASNSVYFDDIHITFPFGVFRPTFIAKYLNDGTIEWVRYLYGTTSGEYALINDIDCMDDGSLIATGEYTHSLLQFSDGFSPVGPQTPGDPDFFISKFSADGDRIWVNVSPPLNGFEGGVAISVENDVIHLIRGLSGVIINDVDTLGSYGSFDLLLEQYTPTGDLLAYTHIGGSNMESGTDLVVHNNSIYVIGATQSPVVNVGSDSFMPDHSSSMYIIKLSQSPIGISPVAQEQQGSIYPNPCTGAFTIIAQGLVGTIKVIDVTGKVVFSGLANAFGSTTVELPNVPSGIYVVQYQSDGALFKRKVVVSEH